MNCWYDTGQIHIFMFLYAEFWPSHWNVTAEIKSHQIRQHFPNFPSSVILSKLSPHFSVPLWREWHRAWSLAAVTWPPQSSACYAFSLGTLLLCHLSSRDFYPQNFCSPKFSLLLTIFGLQPYYVEIPILVWSPKLSNVKPGQYLDEGPFGSTRCRKLEYDVQAVSWEIGELSSNLSWVCCIHIHANTLWQVINQKKTWSPKHVISSPTNSHWASTVG